MTAAVVVLAFGVRVAAHEGESHGWGGPGALSAWDLGVVLMLAASGALYVAGARRLAARGAVQRRREHVAFACGWGVLMVTVLPPIDQLAIELFSMHMVQHELMILAAAPLIMAGRPLSTCLWGLPAVWRGRAGTAMAVPSLSAAWRRLTNPAVAWVLHGAAIWIWHIPVLYGAAVASEGIHALQHATFIGTSALFWWGLLYGRYGRAGYGAAVFYVFTTVVHTGVLGALLTFTGAPLYPEYLAPTVARGLEPLEDQQLAGLLMWIPAGIVLTLLGIGLFAAWVGEAERRQHGDPIGSDARRLSGGIAP